MYNKFELIDSFSESKSSFLLRIVSFKKILPFRVYFFRDLSRTNYEPLFCFAGRETKQNKKTESGISCFIWDRLFFF